MISKIAHSEGEVEARPGNLVFELAESQLGPFAIHVGIFVGNVDSLGGATMGLLDWPYALGLREDQLREAGSRSFSIPPAGCVVGYVTTSEDEILNDKTMTSVIETARFLLREVKRKVLRMGSAYAVYPARSTPFRPENDSDLEVAFGGSCVGFVEECFQRAEFDIVDESLLPPCPSTELAKVWHLIFHGAPRSVSELEDELCTCGVPKPYRLLLPGYQLSAADREEYPFRPGSWQDTLFPQQ